MILRYQKWRQARPAADNTDLVDYVYSRGTTDTPPAIATGGNTNDTFAPTGWSRSVQQLGIAGTRGWRATRTRPDTSSNWTDFGNAERWDEVGLVPDAIGVETENGNFMLVLAYTPAQAGDTVNVTTAEGPAYQKFAGEYTPYPFLLAYEAISP